MQPTTLFAGSVRLLIIFLVFTFSVSLYGQEKAPKTIQLEAQATWQNFPLSNSLMGERSGVLTFSAFEAAPKLGFGVGLRALNERGWYSRYGLVNLSLNRSVDLVLTTIRDVNPISNTSGMRARMLNLHLRYERGKYFPAGKNITFGLGLMLDPVLTQRKTEPLSPLGFHSTVTMFRLDAGIVPSVALRLAGRVQMVLETPLPLARLSYQSGFSDNPFLPEDDRRTGTAELDLLSHIFQVAVGVRVNL